MNKNITHQVQKQCDKGERNTIYYMTNCISRIIMADVKRNCVQTIASEITKAFTIMEQYGMNAARYHLEQLCDECVRGKYSIFGGRH